MMASTNEASIWTMRSVNRPTSEIIHEMKGVLSAGQVRRILRRWKPGWRTPGRGRVKVAPKIRRGRPPKVTGVKKAGIAKSLTAGKTPRDVAIRLGISETSVRRVARSRDVIYSIAQVKPELSADHQAARLEFSDEMLQRATDWWKYVMFTDECKIPLTPTQKRATIAIVEANQSLFTPDSIPSGSGFGLV